MTSVRRVTAAAAASALGTLLVAGLGAAPASANAPNPIQSVTGSAPTNPDGSVTVTLKGSWSWDTLTADDDDGATKSSPQLQCGQRYGIGWAVDWWGLGTGNSKTAPASFTVQNDASQLTPASGSTSPQNSPVTFTGGHSASGPVAGYTGPITESPVAGIQIQGTNQTFWVGGVSGNQNQGAPGYAGGTQAVYDGYDAPLCPTSSGPSGQVDSNGAPIGVWSARATYPSASDVPKVLCVNFYDMHQKEFQPPNPGGSDWSPAADGDNSIQTNAYNPNIGGNCFETPAITPASSSAVAAPPAPAPTPVISVLKQNDASGSGYAQDEMARAPGEDVPFQVTVTNHTPEAVRITSLTDTYSGRTFNPMCRPDPIGTVLSVAGRPGDSTVCHFTIAHYAPPAGQSLTDTIKVTAEVVASSSSSTGSSNSTTGAANSTTGSSSSTTASSSSTTASAVSTVTSPAAPASAAAPAAPVVSASARPATRAAVKPAPAAPAPAGPAAATHTAPNSLAFTGAPAGLRIMVLAALAALLLGGSALWVTRFRGARTRG